LKFSLSLQSPTADENAVNRWHVSRGLSIDPQGDARLFSSCAIQGIFASVIRPDLIENVGFGFKLAMLEACHSA
jgi:hypothetical protein